MTAFHFSVKGMEECMEAADTFHVEAVGRDGHYVLVVSVTSDGKPVEGILISLLNSSGIPVFDKLRTDENGILNPRPVFHITEPWETLTVFAENTSFKPERLRLAGRPRHPKPPEPPKLSNAERHWIGWNPFKAMWLGIRKGRADMKKAKSTCPVCGITL